MLSLIAPLLNEAQNVEPLYARLRAAAEGLDLAVEFIFVDDGSQDATAANVLSMAQRDPRVRLVQLSRNFGHQAALCAGLSAARGDAALTLDGDLQHPPELIPEFVRLWRSGAEVVQGVRRSTADSGMLKRWTSALFYRLLTRCASVRVAPGAADFRLLDRAALDAFLCCQERNRFNRGLVQWIGFEQRELAYDAPARRAGASKYSWRAMLRLAADAVFSFSWAPLRLAGLAGLGVSLAALLYLGFVVWARLFTQRTVEGWSSTLATVLILGGMQLVVLWILGEYVGRLYEESKQRPLFIVRPQPRQSSVKSTDLA